MPAHDSDTRYFAGPEGWIAVHGAAPLLEQLGRLAPAWPSAAMIDGPAQSQLFAQHEDGGWQFQNAEQSMPSLFFDDGLTGALGLLGALIWSSVAQGAAYACLHAAAIDTAEGLLVLAGDALAGKSTLSLAFAAVGRRMVCDDRLVVRLDQPPEGIGMGLTPKLRLPLPPNAPDTFRRFVARHELQQSEGLALIGLKPEAILGFGVRRPLLALVLLDRDGFSPPRLEEAERTEMLDVLLEGGFAPCLDAVGRLQAFHRLTDLPCLRLTYGDSFAAAAFLAANFP